MPCNGVILCLRSFLQHKQTVKGAFIFSLCLADPQSADGFLFQYWIATIHPLFMEETTMDTKKTAAIAASAAYTQLKRRRNKLGGILTLIVLAIYYGWIALIAFNREFLAQRTGEGVTTIAVPIGISVIIVMVILTGIYVVAANKTYDALIEQVKKEAAQ